MFGKFFDTAEVDRFADWILSELKRSLPPQPGTDKDNVARRAGKVNERISRRTSEFVQGTKLNLYTKARLAARVREGMSAHGYPAGFVKAFSYDLLAQVQTASRQLRR